MKSWKLILAPSNCLYLGCPAGASAEPKSRGSYQTTDPDSGMTILLPASYFPDDYSPPQSGPCDASVEKLIERYRSLTPYAIVGLVFVAGVTLRILLV